MTVPLEDNFADIVGKPRCELGQQSMPVSNASASHALIQEIQKLPGSPCHSRSERG